MRNEFAVKVKHGPASQEGRCKFSTTQARSKSKKSPEIMSLVCIIGETHGCCSWNYVYLGFLSCGLSTRIKRLTMFGAEFVILESALVCGCERWHSPRQMCKVSSEIFHSVLALTFQLRSGCFTRPISSSVMSDLHHNSLLY